MFSHSRMNSDGLYTKEMTGPSSSTQLGVPSHEPGNQDSSWIGFFSSMISRPNFSFLQRYLPGRPQSQSSSGTGWISGEFQQSLACEHMFLARLEEDWMQTEHRPHVGLLHYQHESNYGIGGGQEPFSLLSTGTSLDWFTKDGLGVMGIHGDRDMDMYSKDPVPANAYVSAARHCLNQVLVNVISAQDAKSGSEVLTGKKGQIIERENSTWVSAGAATAGQVKRSWWGHFWGSDCNNTAGSGAQGMELLGRSEPVQQSKEKDSTGIHQQLQPSPVAAVPNPPVHIVQREGAPLCAENAGYQFHKAHPPDNRSSQTALPEPFLSEKPLLAFGRPYACAIVAATATFSTEAVVLTPDQDIGYSSWEEEHFGSKSHKMEACCLSQASSEAVRSEQQSCGEPLIGVSSGTMGPEGEMEQRDTGDATLACDDSNVEAQIEVASQSLPVLTSPQCQNKTIAFIMGSPCSEESESESDLDQDWDSDDVDDDDDGFNSEGSSDFSESEEDDTDEEGGTEEAEKERLWNSFSQSRDPYNPQNFTAAIQTVKLRAPFEEDATTTEEEVTEAECPSGSQSPWNCEDDHSSCDEAESLKLWNSFSCRGDPYNPLNFMVPISTKQGGERCSAPLSSKQKAGRRVPSPSMQMEEAEERLDSGFSETCHTEQAQKTSNRCGKQKKVMFVDEVEEFYASCDEDRRGPWEELARDRCRFLRRVQETEDTVGCCLAPAHRQKVFERLYEKC